MSKLLKASAALLSGEADIQLKKLERDHVISEVEMDKFIREKLMSLSSNEALPVILKAQAEYPLKSECITLNRLHKAKEFIPKGKNAEGNKTECSTYTDRSYMSASSAGIVGSSLSGETLVDGINNAKTYGNLADELSKLNTMRGGTKGFKGFVFEELHATDATLNGMPTEVINNNGIADLVIKNADGTYSYAQAKAGYKTGNIDFSAYKEQTIIVDKGNAQLIEKAKAAGLNVKESNISLKDAENLSKKMQLETKITGKSNSIVVPKTQEAVNLVKNAHTTGLKTAKTSGQFGMGFSLGSNLVDVASGDKEMKDAMIDIAKDTVVSTGIGYATGAVAAAVGNTAIGIAVTEGVAAAGTAVACSAVGTAAVAAGTAVTGTVTAAGTAIASSAVGTAVTGTVTAVGTAIATSTVGTAVTGTVAAAGTAIAGTAIGAAAIAAAPVVLGAVALGAGIKIIKNIFRR